MPTELPDLTTEFVRRYNEQVAKLRQPIEPRPEKPSENPQVLEELPRPVEGGKKQIQALSGQLHDCEKRCVAAVAEAKSNQEKLELAIGQVAQKQSQLRTLSAELKSLQSKYEDLRSKSEELKNQQVNSSGTKPSSPAALKSPEQLLKEITQYKNRLNEERGAESSIVSGLKSAQRDEYAEALAQQLTGMKNRYQLLSTWKFSRPADESRDAEDM